MFSEFLNENFEYKILFNFKNLFIRKFKLFNKLE